MSTAATLEPLGIRTVELTGADAEAVADLVGILPAHAPLTWTRGGDGLVGWGEAARLVISGEDRFTRAARWWRALCADAAIEDELRLPGTGPVLFGSFAFAAGPTPSVLVLPRVVVGRRGGRTWLTRVGGHPDRTVPSSGVAPVPVPRVCFDDATPERDWRDAIAAAVRRIRAGELSKVVLARDLMARADGPLDVRHLLRGLAARYPACFTFSVDGLVGATPELLVRRFGDQITSRVLAGTAWRDAGSQTGAAEPTADIAARLVASAKDREEHAYAARSAADALRPHCSVMMVPQQPDVLALPNVVHLVTEVRGTLAPPSAGADALTLAGALHPTAAVCGTPSDVAARVIADLEHMDRGRYAGPVGWVDAAGDGEWGIALRCAEIDGARIRLFAGCGIVAGSEPDAEVAEATAKFAAVREVLEN